MFFGSLGWNLFSKSDKRNYGNKNETILRGKVGVGSL